MRSALEVADVFRRHGAAYREAHAGHLSRGQRRVMGAIETAARQRWAVMSNSATAAASFASPTIPAATGTARSAKGWHVPNGWPTDSPSCCRCRTSTSSSRCRRRSPRSLSTIRPSSMASCSPPPPRRCASSLPIPGISAPRSGWSPSCTPGDRTCISTHAHNTLSADNTNVQVFYPFHPLRGATLQILRSPKRGDGAVCVIDPAGRQLKIPGLDAVAGVRQDERFFATTAPGSGSPPISRFIDRLATPDSKRTLLTDCEGRSSWCNFNFWT